VSQLREFAYSFSLLVFPAAAGYALRRRLVDPLTPARRIQIFNIIVFNPLVSCFAIWILSIDRQLVVLPSIGLVVSLALMGLSVAITRARGMPPPQSGSYVFSAAISNIGHTMGGFVCFVLIGEHAFSLSVIYHLYFMFFTYLVCFPLARSYSPSHKAGLWAGVVAAFTDVRSMPLVGIVIGFVLLGMGVERPAFMSNVQAFIVSFSTALTMFGLGMTFQFRSLKKYRRDCVEMSLIKFVFTPALALLAIWVCGLTGLTAQVVLMLSFMPTAIYACIIATLFELDVDLANAAFFVTTAVFVVVVLPVLAFAVGP